MLAASCKSSKTLSSVWDWSVQVDNPLVIPCWNLVIKVTPAGVFDLRVGLLRPPLPRLLPLPGLEVGRKKSTLGLSPFRSLSGPGSKLTFNGRFCCKKWRFASPLWSSIGDVPLCCVFLRLIAVALTSSSPLSFCFIAVRLWTVEICMTLFSTQVTFCQVVAVFRLVSQVSTLHLDHPGFCSTV